MITKDKEVIEMFAECKDHGISRHTKQDTGYFFCDKCMQTNCGLIYGRLFSEMKKISNLKYQFIEKL